jgi:hypothetical protein
MPGVTVEETLVRTPVEPGNPYRSGGSAVTLRILTIRWDDGRGKKVIATPNQISSAIRGFRIGRVATREIHRLCVVRDSNDNGVFFAVLAHTTDGHRTIVTTRYRDQAEFVKAHLEKFLEGDRGRQLR